MRSTIIVKSFQYIGSLYPNESFKVKKLDEKWGNFQFDVPDKVYKTYKDRLYVKIVLKDSRRTIEERFFKISVQRWRRTRRRRSTQKNEGKVVKEAEESARCPNCGYALEEDAFFCTECGVKVK